MSTIQPSAMPLSTAQSVGTVLTPLTLTDAASAAALAVLDQGTVVDAQVQDKTATGQVIITTDQTGPLTLSAKGAAADLLTTGAKVVLQVIAGADGQLALRLLSVDAQALAKPIIVTPPAVLSETPIDPAKTAPVAQATPPQPISPAGLMATVIRPAVPPVAMQASSVVAESMPLVPDAPATPQILANGKSGGLPDNLPIGTTVTVRILDVNAAPPTQASLSKQPLEGEASPLPLTEAVAPTQALIQQKPSAPLDTASSPPEIVPDTVQTDSSASSVLEGKVVSTVPGQRVMVSTPIGVLSLPAVPALKTNAEVRFQVMSPPAPPATDLSDKAQETISPIKTLNDALNSLAAAGDMAAVQKVMSIIPQLDARLAACMAVVLKSFDRQSGRTLVDKDEVEGLVKSGKKDAAGRVAGALGQLQDDVVDYPGQDGGWRGFTVPLATGTLIEPVQFFIRQPPSDDAHVNGDDKGTGGTAKNRDQRFLVEIMLTRMGRFQMDGLVQRVDKRFDLIVRTQKPLSGEMRNDITALFISTTEAAGSKGSVLFQSGGRFVSVKQTGDHTKLSV